MSLHQVLPILLATYGIAVVGAVFIAQKLAQAATAAELPIISDTAVPVTHPKTEA